MYPHSDIIATDEICDNAIDDDDGLIDLNDPDCECEIIELESFIPNPSFEDLDCCPQEPAELDCASGWIQASFPTTDFIHLCDWLGWNNAFDVFPPPQPFPDGEGIVGFRDGVITPPGGPDPIQQFEPNWKEYAGACLLSPMKADSSYRIEFDIGFVNPVVSPPIQVTLFGTTDCSYLPFGEDDSFGSLTGCPTNAPGWVKLGFATVISVEGNEWLQAAIEVVPEEDILAIAIGPDCFNNLNESNLYYFLDNLLLDETQSFELNITPTSHPCQDDFALQTENHPGLSYQWYLDGVALLGETSAQLSQMYGEGHYQVRIIDGADCKLSSIYPVTNPALFSTFNQSICEGEAFFFADQELTDAGIYTDTLTSIDGCDSIIVLNLDIVNDLVDTVNVVIFEGETYEIENYSFSQPGDYFIMTTSLSGCDLLIVLHLEYLQVYIPNVFTPNHDGVNDTFTILAEDRLVQHVDLTIFDRWGGIVYKGAEWDGRYNNEFVNPGAYVYLIEVTLISNSTHRFSGSITVLL